MKWWSKLLYCFDKKNRHYVSPVDHFLEAFDAQHPTLSNSQRLEMKKHADIFNRPSPQRIDWS